MDHCPFKMFPQCRARPGEIALHRVGGPAGHAGDFLDRLPKRPVGPAVDLSKTGPARSMLRRQLRAVE